MDGFLKRCRNFQPMSEVTNDVSNETTSMILYGTDVEKAEISLYQQREQHKVRPQSHCDAVVMG